MLAGDAVYPWVAEVVLSDALDEPIHRLTVAQRTDPDLHGELRPLDRRVILLWRITWGGRGAVAFAVLLGLEILLGPPFVVGLLSGLVALATLAAVAGLPPLQYRRWRFGLEAQHLRLRYGVLFRTTSIVPYARIQHVDTRHGPLERWLHLATLVVFTAGTRGAVLTIPALAVEEAEAIRDHLVALSGAGDAV